MRRDVRLLGDMLGEVISESGGADLLADVERLRHAVIDARAGTPTAASAAAAAGGRDRGAGRLVVWSRAEQVARAFTVYFHLANLAEEQQRVRTLRERDIGGPAAARVAGRRGRADPPSAGRDHLARAARRAARAPGAHRAPDRGPPPRGGRGAAPDRRPADRWTTTSGPRREQRRGPARGCREEIDLLWRTAQLRVAAMTPIDEVRTVMAAFDETLFRLVPGVYRALDQACSAPESGAVGLAGAARSCGSAAGSAPTGTATRS